MRTGTRTWSMTVAAALLLGVLVAPRQPAVAQVTGQAKLQAGDGTAGTFFGIAVAVDGDTLVVGVKDARAAYVFVRTGGVWSQEAKLDGPASAAGFGNAVAVDGDTVVVGAPYEDVAGPLSGAAYVFIRQAGQWDQVPPRRLTAIEPAAVDFFGVSVAVSGDTAVVGSYGDQDLGGFTGSAYVFDRGDGWTSAQKLAPVPGDREAGQGFGLWVDVDGDTILVGAPYDQIGGPLSGAGFVFVRGGGWVQQGPKLTAVSPSPFVYFGYSVALSGDTALVGSLGGAAYVFTRSATVWSQPVALTAPDAWDGDLFGRRVALAGDTAVVAAVADDDRGPDSGSAYVFVRGGGGWSLAVKLTAADGAAGDQLGYSAALSAGTAVIGAPLGDDPTQGADAGAAYVFTLDVDPAPPQTADAAVFVYAGEARPGFDLEYSLVTSNLGELTAQGVSVGLTLPAEVTSPPTCSPACDVQWTAGRFRLSWSRPDVLPGGGETLTAVAELPAGTPLGTLLEATARISTTTPDDRDGNDFYDHKVVVVGSYDPNDKGVSPQGFLRGDEELFYVVHFENEGTADAIHVTVRDPLAPELDAATLVLGDGGSYDPATRTIEWALRDVHLPPGATGAVHFSVTPVAGLVPGTEIRNQASIVFDFHPPMLTPETVSILGGEEELGPQEVARRVVSRSLELESILAVELARPDAYFELLDAAVAAAWRAFRAVDGARLPWKPLNDCQARLTEVRDLLQASAELPPALVAEWLAILEELLDDLVASYPEAPVADAGDDPTVEATAPRTPVALDGSGSYDPDPAEGLVSYTWYDDGGTVIATGREPVVELVPGSHRLTLVVNDGEVDSPVTDDGSGDDSVVVVTVADTTPPAIAVSADPEILWPPNHRMVEVTVTLVVDDLVDPAPRAALVSVESDEPDEGLGGGDKPDDVQGADLGTADTTLLLRAERAGNGEGRTYLLTYTAVDAAGNRAEGSVSVVVPHDLGGSR